MSTRFAWRIVVKAKNTIVEGPVLISWCPITDEIIGYAIKDIFSQVKLDVPADEVEMLGFAATFDDDKDGYYEPLDPFKFWPIPPEVLGCEYRDIVRDTKSCKKGGEN